MINSLKAGPQWFEQNPALVGSRHLTDVKLRFPKSQWNMSPKEEYLFLLGSRRFYLLGAIVTVSERRADL
ncbi:hypothetical protein [Epibacterium ulvae]|uniref:hypothetical protein n=1 Tax=Epibacterium ulvae TaxID=1156985 RepID=UPI00249236B0|nr:hypothetical protein [Epibacterium ulvae]